MSKAHQGLKIMRVSAGDQHMGALTKEGKAGILLDHSPV